MEDEIWDRWEDYRAEKEAAAGPEARLANAEAIDGVSALVWAANEREIAVLGECGYPFAVAIVGGEDNHRTSPFNALKPHADALEKIPKHIIALGADVVRREELARRLGRHRCWIVDWPEGRTSAASVKRGLGADAVSMAVTRAGPYPIEGLQRIRQGTLEAFRRRPQAGLLRTGIEALDTVLRLPAEGRLIIITGIPGGGKSTWCLAMSVLLMQRHGRRFLVFSPEMQPWEAYVALCAQSLSGRPFWPVPGGQSMSDGEIADAEAWLADRMVLQTSDAQDVPPNLDKMLEGASAAVLQSGITDWLVDPWNEVEHSRGNLSETEYVGRSLQRLKAFGYRHGVNVWIVAHPTKLHPAKPGERLQPPGLYDCSGGANWANKADIGLCIHTPGSVSQVHVLKTRFGRWGRKGDLVELEFDALSMRYSGISGAESEIPAERMNQWG